MLKNLKKYLPKLDKDRLLTDLVRMGILAAVVGIGMYWGFKKIGIFSYNGLPKAQVDKSYQEFMKRYPVISKVGGYIYGQWFERGIAAGGIPIYFHYLTDGKTATFSYYLTPVEFWTTDNGILNIGKYFTQQPMYP